MVSDNKVSISIMFCVMFRGFLSFDIPIVSKNMFLSCFYHVSYKFILVFPIYVPLKNIFYIMSCLWHYFPFQLCVTSFYNFFFYVFNTLIFLLLLKLRETWFIWF
jgi:hypothetical protein